MTEAELECAVYGEGTVFPVRIALDAKFSALQAAIAAIVSSEQCTVAPRLVALSLAKTERGWVRSDAAFEDFLKQGRQDTTPYTKMIPNWKLNKAEYFGPEFRPGDDDIHVFVELPVPVPTARDESGYFITTAVQEQAKNAVFLKVADDDGRDRDGVGMGVFFTPTLAVTCDHNLNVEYLVGIAYSEAISSFVEWKPKRASGSIGSRLGILSLGINELQRGFANRLGFAPAASICLSAHETFIMYSCSTYVGDCGAALILKNGRLVGIHRDTVNALSEEMDRKQEVEERLNVVEQSLENIVRSELAQGCIGLLIHEVTRAVDDELADAMMR